MPESDISHHLNEPQPWAVEAACLPLAFAQVREDPRLDLEIAATLPPGANVVMIASGGETALCLARLPLRQLHLVDMNSAQLALTRLKWRIAAAGDPSALQILGHRFISAEERHNLLLPYLEALALPSDVFGPPEVVAAYGPDHSGRYERAFARLRFLMSPDAGRCDELVRTIDPRRASCLIAPDTSFGQALDASFAKVFALPNLVRLFGAEATQNPARPFHEHFPCRLRVAVSRHPAFNNPFLWQILVGAFPPRCPYDWLLSPAKPTVTPLVSPTYHHGKMAEVLDSMAESSMDMVHLSNILDWLSPLQAEATLRSAFRALKPGGRFIIRQLNSMLDIASLASGFIWDHDHAADMEFRDRSFFYPRILIGTRAW